MATSHCPGCLERDRRIAELGAQLEKAQRANKRQAAPFSKGEPKKHPKSTARPSGAAYGKHGHRPSPSDDQIDETLEASLSEWCPHCGGDIADLQFQEEILIRLIRRRFRIPKGDCRGCGRVSVADIPNRLRMRSVPPPASSARMPRLPSSISTSTAACRTANQRSLRTDRWHPLDAQRLCSGRATSQPATAARLRRHPTPHP
jgi:hypothetical protein